MPGTRVWDQHLTWPTTEGTTLAQRTRKRQVNGRSSSRTVNGAGPSSSTSPSPTSTAHRIPSAEREAIRALRNMEMRSLLARDTQFSSMLGRIDFANRVGIAFDGSRDYYASLGYKRDLQFRDYYEEYKRGGLAERIVEVYPFATWAGGAKIVADPNPNVENQFEKTVRELFDRLDVWQKLTRADILACLGHYSVVLIGAPGDARSPLPTGLKDVFYFKPISEADAVPNTFDKDRSSPRFGRPLTYLVAVKTDESATDTVEVHWERLLHVAEGTLDSDLYGKPRLRAVWNYLDDLKKIVGGGGEASWKRMDPGLHVDIDPEIEMDETEEQKLTDELDEYQHDLRRFIRTRGTKVNPLATQVQGFGPNADAVVKLIAATTGIPHRILTGSERGELASTQDRFNWSDRINERRRGFATPLIREFLRRLIDKGVLPQPSPSPQMPAGYDIVWPEVGEISNTTKAEILNKLAAANQAMKVAGLPPVIFPNEMRASVLGLGPITDEQMKEWNDIMAEQAKVKLQAAQDAVGSLNQPPNSAADAGKGSGPDNPQSGPPASAPINGASAGR